MKKIIVLFVCAIFLTGCEKNPDVSQKENSKVEADSSKKDDKQQTEKKEDAKEELDSTETGKNEEQKKRDGVIYYVDGEKAAIVTEALSVQNETDVWNELKSKEVLSEECKLLKFEINVENASIDLDIDKSTGDRIRSMGTTGETEIITCLVNSYLDTFGCEKIRITEAGAELETSHGAELSGYITKMDI